MREPYLDVEGLIPLLVPGKQIEPLTDPPAVMMKTRRSNITLQSVIVVKCVGSRLVMESKGDIAGLALKYINMSRFSCRTAPR